MNRIDSRRAYEDSHRAFSLAKQPTMYQVQDHFAKFTQMAADLLGGPVALALPIGMRVVREPVVARRA
jgi:hypothetical protein